MCDPWPFPPSGLHFAFCHSLCSGRDARSGASDWEVFSMFGIKIGKGVFRRPSTSSLTYDRFITAPDARGAHGGLDVFL